MLNPIKEIYNWQVAAGNTERPYDDFLESSFQIEEALEGFSLNQRLAEQLGIVEYPGFSSPKQLSRTIIKLIQSDDDQLSDVDRLDKACDAIIFAIGSMAKLGLDHHGITKALNIVNSANKAKLGMPRDEHGKLLKPDDFVGPEVHLQALLDSIKD